MGIKLQFKEALRVIVSEQLKGNNPVPDVLGFLHVQAMMGHNMSRRLRALVEKYSGGDESPMPLLKADIPKVNFTIRPMARPSTEDWIVYEAITRALSRRILENEEICKRSFSILNFKTPRARSTDSWLKFDNQSRKYYEDGYKYAVAADLTGYYENISLDELRRRTLNYLGGDTDGNKLVAALFSMLRKWSDERISGYGLPQGPPASSFLADIFLDHVDRRMEGYEGYFRYMDDIRVFCGTSIQAKIALKELTIALRDLKLNINAKKTEILSGTSIERKLFDPHKSLLSAVEQLMKSGRRQVIQEAVVPTLVKLFEGAFSNDAFEKTHVSFGLYRLGVLLASGLEFDTDRVVEAIKGNFIAKPHHAGLFCDFLSMFPEDSDVTGFLISFLKSDENIYDGQELKILQCLLKFNVTLERTDVDFFISSARDSNKHFAVRSYYFLLAGKYGSNRDRDFIVSSYDESASSYLKQAVVLAVQELGRAPRNHFYARLKRQESDETTQFIDYVKSLRSPVYFLAPERPKLETYEEFQPRRYGYV